MNPYRAKAKASHAAKIKGYASGGRVPEDIAESEPKMMKGKEGEGKGFASGGMVMGMKAPKKAHKAKKAGTHINIINMPHGGAGAPPMGPPPGPGPGVGMIPPPVRPVAPAPMPGPMGMPPPGVGPGPMMRKNGGRVAFKKGGRVNKADGGEVDNENSSIATSSTPVLDKVVKDSARAKSAWKMTGDLNDAADKVKGKATGGRVSRPTPIAKPDSGKYDAGAATGEGREENIKAYGKNAGKAAKSSSTS